MPRRGKIEALLLVGVLVSRLGFAMKGDCFKEYLEFSGLRVRSFQARGDDKLLKVALETSENPERTRAAIREVDKERATTSLAFDKEGRFVGGAIYKNSRTDIEILDFFSLPGTSSREVCTATLLRLMSNVESRPSGTIRMRLRSSAKEDQELLRSLGFKMTQFEREGFPEFGEDAMVFSYVK